MSTITIENWKVTEDVSPEFQFVPPEYHVTYWEIPKWWYKGAQSCYTSCVRIDVGETSIYVDGTSPLMQFTLEWEEGGEGSATFSNWRCIDRALFLNKNNLGAINRDESNEYIDVEFDDYFYRIRYDNYFGPDVIEPLQADIKPLWLNGGLLFYQDPLPFTTGTYIGGVEPVTYEYRHKEFANNKWTTPTGYSPQTNTPTEQSITLDPKTKAVQIHIETKATDADGTIVYNNGAYLNLNNPVPVITESPTLSSRNFYVTGQALYAYCGEFTNGLPDAVARARWQWRASKDDNWTNENSSSWTNNVSYLQEIISPPIPDGMVQVRFMYQIVENSTNTGNGPRNVSNSVVQDIAPAEPLEIAPNGGANWLAGNTYEVGETVYGKTAMYTGGIDPITYRWRIQTRATPQDSWTNGPWTNVTNVKADVEYVIQDVGQLRIASQAREENAPNATSNSFTGAQTVSS